MVHKCSPQRFYREQVWTTGTDRIAEAISSNSHETWIVFKLFFHKFLKWVNSWPQRFFHVVAKTKMHIKTKLISRTNAEFLKRLASPSYSVVYLLSKRHTTVTTVIDSGVKTYILLLVVWKPIIELSWESKVKTCCTAFAAPSSGW